ncbi:MAG: flagellar basal body-associated protein FliL [Hyphomicrobiales bacterium]|nr:flagellar basal body-associated protein FliL [Hyphomicrobiales bacterium]
MSASGEKKTGGKGGVMALVLLTLVAAGAGAAHGLQTYSLIEAAGPAKPAATPAPVVAAAPAGHGAPAPSGGHGAPAAHDASAKPAEKVKLPSKIVIKNLQPLITNIMLPTDLWVRLEAAIVYDQAEVDDPDIMLTEISGDLMAYLRTLTLREMQGADGLMFVRQDMRERINLRTKGLARDIIIQTLVVQ